MTDDSGTGNAVSTPGEITINIQGANDEATAQDDDLGEVIEDGPAVEGTVDAPDDLDDNDVYTYQTVANSLVDENGVEVVGGDITWDGNTYTFDPLDDFQYLREGDVLPLAFSYEIQELSGNITAPAVVSLEIIGANDQPVAEDNALNTTENDLVYVGGSTFIVAEII